MKSVLSLVLFAGLALFLVPCVSSAEEQKSSEIVIDFAGHADILLMNVDHASMATVYGAHATIVRWRQVYFSGVGVGWRDVDGKAVFVLPIATVVFHKRDKFDLAATGAYVMGGGDNGFGFGISGTF